MDKKTINQEPTFIQSINIASKWCKDWEENLLSDEVLADRIAELIRTKNGIRGFFAYALSDMNCNLLDKLPTAFIFKLREGGEEVIKIIVKNLVMSSAQVINHRKDNNQDYEVISENISDRCSNLLKLLDTRSVTQNINQTISNLDQMGNSFDNSIKYNKEQKEFIKEKIKDISH